MWFSIEHTIGGTQGETEEFLAARSKVRESWRFLAEAPRGGVAAVTGQIDVMTQDAA